MAHYLRLVAFLAMVGAIALQLPVNRARAAEPASQDATASAASRVTPSTPDTVTIQAHKNREIKRQITKFVSGGVVTPLDESLQRWNQPICPVVAGLQGDAAEFILTRMSQVARDSHAPFASKHCTPNLVVVATDDPDPLVERWYKHFRSLFDTCHGSGPVQKFLHSRQAIRVFYNATTTATGGPGLGVLVMGGVNLPTTSGCLSVGAGDTWLHHGSVKALTSVIIVVDGRQITKIKINLGQLADYITMVGLAQIREQADTGTAPSILHLFQGSDPQPTGLSPWDAAFLHSLYTTDQSSVLEVPIIEDRMFQQIVGR